MTEHTDFPKECKCGFVAQEPKDMEAHAAVEHPEVFDDGAGSR